jgi:hypothetical protein
VLSPAGRRYSLCDSCLSCDGRTNKLYARMRLSSFGAVVARKILRSWLVISLTTADCRTRHGTLVRVLHTRCCVVALLRGGSSIFFLPLAGPAEAHIIITARHAMIAKREGVRPKCLFDTRGILHPPSSILLVSSFMMVCGLVVSGCGTARVVEKERLA